ncbi:MAG: hypothetical protein ABSE52_11060 [Candidatus Dormibacteria bacterium]|jgi:hypothetical protein
MAVSNLTMVSLMEARIPERATITAGCRERGCTAPASAKCAYVDGRGRSCETAWCHRHLHTIGAEAYCRRHAGTVAALGGKANDPRALPAVDHRGASLVNWICIEGHSALHGAVASALRPGEVIFEDRTVNVVRQSDASRRWERGWRIGDRSGLRSKVLVCVDESDDSLVLLAVDDKVVAVAVPPWITRRRANQPVTSAIDASDRSQFYGFLCGHIQRSLALRP